jgi:hypothetical protein
MPDEVKALADRLSNAEVSAASRGITQVLNDFGDVVESESVAVIARGLPLVCWLASGDNALYTSFQKQVSSGERIPEDNQWDQSRAAVEGAIYPNYSAEITFGALSIDRIGALAYGAYCIVLKTSMIESRTTIFDENPFEFFKRHQIVLGTTSIPAGYRSTWSDRGKAAKAKLHPKLEKTTSRDEFASLLLSQGAGGTGMVECMETHIFGPIHRRAIERVIGRKPKNKADGAILRSLRTNLESVGASLELV